MASSYTAGPAGTREFRGNAGELDHLLGKMDYHSAWKSPESFYRHVNDMDVRKAWTKSGWDQGNISFYGTESMAAAMKLAQDGWKEGAEDIQRMISKIKAKRPSSPKLAKYGVSGVTPNVPRAVSGNILNMRQPDPDKLRKKPVITILAEMGANCGVSHTAISNRAAAVAAVIDELESSGYACEVISVASSKGGWGGEKDFISAISVKVKESNQPVDLIRMAFSLGHAGMFRRLMFADWGTSVTCERGLGRSLGHGGAFDSRADMFKEKQIYVLPSADDHPSYFKDAESTLNIGVPYLIEELRQQGCPAFKNLDEWKAPGQKKKKFSEPDDDDDVDDVDDDF
jgi:hypothetical protein